MVLWLLSNEICRLFLLSTLIAAAALDAITLLLMGMVASSNGRDATIFGEIQWLKEPDCARGNRTI